MVETHVLTPDDWVIWRELRLQALPEAPYAFSSRLADWQGDGDREDRWRARLNIPGSHNVVALIDGEAVGMASGVPTEDDEVAAVISMWVSPAGRGRGIGDALLRAVTDWARSIAARELRLTVAEGNAAAVASYERNGFRFTGELGDRMHDGTSQELVMKREL